MPTPSESPRSRRRSRPRTRVLRRGRALIATGRRDAAIIELEHAESVAARHGADGVHRDAIEDLRRLGRRRAPRGPAHAGADGVATLSEREREVAELVTDRETNKQIAAELFLSEKTVETHPRNIFFELSVSSRVDVAKAIEAARIRESP